MCQRVDDFMQRSVSPHGQEGGVSGGQCINGLCGAVTRFACEPDVDRDSSRAEASLYGLPGPQGAPARCCRIDNCGHTLTIVRTASPQFLSDILGYLFETMRG